MALGNTTEYLKTELKNLSKLSNLHIAKPLSSHWEKVSITVEWRSEIATRYIGDVPQGEYN